ncbi:MAG TPA: RNA polymerase factor sigma-54, partial [Rudaea sp.]|nr:RNA polymerase factor sigma-54 [Rudaea sp.]
MKQRLSAATQQHLVLTPQLRQAIRLLQLSATELEAEVAEAVASNPLLDWQEDATAPAPSAPGEAGAGEATPEPEPPWEYDAEPWQESPGTYHGDVGEADQPGSEDTLQDHLLWQLHLGHFSPRDTRIGIALIDAI